MEDITATNIIPTLLSNDKNHELQQALLEVDGFVDSSSNVVGVLEGQNRIFQQGGEADNLVAETEVAVVRDIVLNTMKNENIIPEKIESTNEDSSFSITATAEAAGIGIIEHATDSNISVSPNDITPAIITRINENNDDMLKAEPSNKSNNIVMGGSNNNVDIISSCSNDSNNDDSITNSTAIEEDEEDKTDSTNTNDDSSVTVAAAEAGIEIIENITAGTITPTEATTPNSKVKEEDSIRKVEEMSNPTALKKRKKKPKTTKNEDDDITTASNKKKRPKKRRCQRRIKFSNGTMKPTEYLEAQRHLDDVTAERLSYVASVNEKEEASKDTTGNMTQAQEDLCIAKANLENFDASDAMKKAKERLIKAELSITDLPFTRKYLQLLAYKQKHGHVDLPTRIPENKELDSLCIFLNRHRATWKKYLKGTHKVKHIHHFELLSDLGVVWDRRDKWDEQYANLRTFKDQHGHCLVPQHYTDRKLAVWVGYQRQELNLIKRNGSSKYLTPDRMERLNQLGFVWNVFDLRWNQMFDRLKKFRETNGHFHVSESDLLIWIKKQREQYVMYQDEKQRKCRKCKLTPEKLQQLQSIGFEL